ncbi:MAG: hypothetical protein U0470_12760 [Anaerolineae bacterium]
MLGPLADAGLGGLESPLHGLHGPREPLAGRAGRVLRARPDRRQRLHGPHRPHGVLGGVRVPADTVERLREAAGRPT